MSKLEYILGDLVMTNGISGGTAKNVVYKVMYSNPSKICVSDDGTILKGIVHLENLEDAKLEDEGYLYYGNSYVYFKDIIPIPITPEILEKNGWKSINGKYALKIKNANYLVLDFTEDGIYTYINERTMLFVIKYVHELQHLLFGLELNSEMEV